MKTVSVHTKINHYDILIGSGLLAQTGGKLRKLGYSGKAVVITDSIVNEFYGQTLETSLSAAGFETVILTLPPGEKQKTLVNAGRLFTHLNNAYAERLTPVLASGWWSHW